MLGVGDLPSAASVLLAAARQLQDSGDPVFLVDLTREGWLIRAGRGARADLPVHHPQERVGPTYGRLSVAPPPPRLVRQKATRSMRSGLPPTWFWYSARSSSGSGSAISTRGRIAPFCSSGPARPPPSFSVPISRMLMRSGPTLEFAILVGADRTHESLGLPRRVATDEPQRRAR